MLTVAWQIWGLVGFKIAFAVDNAKSEYEKFLCSWPLWVLTKCFQLHLGGGTTKAPVQPSISEAISQMIRCLFPKSFGISRKSCFFQSKKYSLCHWLNHKPITLSVQPWENLRDVLYNNFSSATWSQRSLLSNCNFIKLLEEFNKEVSWTCPLLFSLTAVS